MKPLSSKGKHPEDCYPPETANTRRSRAKWKQLHKGSAREEEKRITQEEEKDN